MRRAVAAILREYNARMETGDADDVATLESLADAIGPASKLDLRECKKFIEIFDVHFVDFNAAL